MSDLTNNNEMNFNLMDDMAICLFLVNEDVPIEQKDFFVNHFRSKLDHMQRREFFLFLTNISQEFCEYFSDYVKETISALNKADTEKILYLNKYSHSISQLARWLITQDWFIAEKNGKYKHFFIANKLEELLNGDQVSQKELESIGNRILDDFFAEDHNPELSDMILNHYINLLENYDPEYISIFKKQGYQIVNSYLSSNPSINQNIIIFFCHMIRMFSGIKDSKVFEFFEDDKSDIVAFHDMYNVKLNTAGIKKVLAMFHSEMATLQYIFFAIGHELNHTSDFEYRRKPKEVRNNPIEEVKAFNVGHAEALFSVKSKAYNLQYHDKYFNEYCCDIAGIKAVQEQQKLLSCIKDEDKIIVNQFFANKLFNAYAWKDGDKVVYISPAEFTRFTFLNIKDIIPQYAKAPLLDGRIEVTLDVREIEQSLDDYNRILMGYYTPYIGVLKLIADGTISTTNLLDSIPVLYEQYRKEIDGKFPSYYETDIFNSKKKQ